MSNHSFERQVFVTTASRSTALEVMPVVAVVVSVATVLLEYLLIISIRVLFVSEVSSAAL